MSIKCRTNADKMSNGLGRIIDCIKECYFISKHRGRSFCNEECPCVTIKTGDTPCDRGTLFKTEETSPKCAVGEFPYMAYDNLGSEAGK